MHYNDNGERYNVLHTMFLTAYLAGDILAVSTRFKLRPLRLECSEEVRTRSIIFNLQRDRIRAVLCPSK